MINELRRTRCEILYYTNGTIYMPDMELNYSILSDVVDRINLFINVLLANSIFPTYELIESFIQNVGRMHDDAYNEWISATFDVLRKYNKTFTLSDGNSISINNIIDINNKDLLSLQFVTDTKDLSMNIYKSIVDIIDIEEYKPLYCSKYSHYIDEIRRLLHKSIPLSKEEQDMISIAIMNEKAFPCNYIALRDFSSVDNKVFFVSKLIESKMVDIRHILTAMNAHSVKINIIELNKIWMKICNGGDPEPEVLEKFKTFAIDIIEQGNNSHDERYIKHIKKNREYIIGMIHHINLKQGPNRGWLFNILF